MVTDGAMVFSRLKEGKYPNVETLLEAIRQIYWEHSIKKDIRPLGVGLVIGTTFDRPRIFEVDASGATAEYSAVAIGNGYDKAMKKLADKYDRMTIKNAGKLMPDILGKDKEFLVETLFL